MQPTSSEKPTELTMWWPSPMAFSDLTVEDTEEGFSLEAPDGTECATWLSYWSQDEEHHEFFEKEFTRVLLDAVKSHESTNGKTEAITDEQSNSRSEAEENQAG